MCAHIDLYLKCVHVKVCVAKRQDMDTGKKWLHLYCWRLIANSTALFGERHTMPGQDTNLNEKTTKQNKKYNLKTKIIKVHTAH